MTFTDEDLARLKVRKSSNPHYTIIEMMGVERDALIHRLEAAEKLAEWVMTWESHENCNSKGCECGLQKDIKAWRKSKGGK